MSGKRGAKEEGEENEEGTLEALAAESLPISTNVSTAPLTWITKLRKPELRAELNDMSFKFEKKDNKSILVELLRLRLRCENGVLGGNNFLNTDDYCRLLVPFLPNDTPITIRLASKPWSRMADGFISGGVESGAIMVHGGKDISFDDAWKLVETRKLVTRAIFLLNITKVEEHGCMLANNLVVVDIPEGIESIGRSAFNYCSSLTTVSFPTTLTSIGESAFAECSILENVDLLHTNLQELGEQAFARCLELKFMTIPDSLQTLGPNVFNQCFKLAPSSIDASHWSNDATSEVVAHLRSKQLQNGP
ncbi:hypothetical protein TL16_g02200 [Triparma laevis f. inornata]|uniref:Uncharacterized protein n=1 Tax=Triparma laevis f. inornata TaxID=1714386 RepID=A0A9W7DWH4_9STRA|nr:hypothetical protein TL16_g02200 [Triparma laevis f. inornata]